MAHFGPGKFLDKVTLFVLGKLPSSCPTSPVRTSLGKSVLVNGVETERQRCVCPGRLGLQCFTAGAHHGSPPIGWPTSLTGSVPQANAASEFPTSGLGREAWHFSVEFPGWGVVAQLLDIPGVGGILSELYTSNQLLTM